MADSLEAKKQFALDVVKKIRASGHQALWAGGCVRDELIGHAPDDYDVATSATPEQVQQIFGRHRTVGVGVAFGVVMVLGPNKKAGQVEVATFRRDESYSDGRRPDRVSYTDAEEDARRRDFTINGLFFDPVDNEIIDYVGGQKDLAAGLIRSIGDPRERFKEDKLRMLRAVRFTAAFGFEIDPDTLRAIKEMHDQLNVVSAERIAAELRRMLVHPRRKCALQLLHNTGLLRQILPELFYEDDADSARHSLEDSPMWSDTLSVIDQLHQPRFPLAFAALLGEVADAGVARAICRRLRLSRDDTDQTSWLVQHQNSLVGADSQPWPILQRLLIQPGIGNLVELHSARISIGRSDQPSLDFCRRKLAQPPDQLNPPPWIAGADLIELGLRPGRQFKAILDQVRDAQLENRVTDKKQAIELAKRLAEEKE